jgi:hypothetical protein
MLVDLDDLATKVLVQEYVNKIVNYDSLDELNHNIHKLIHTFEVVKMAKELIDYTVPKMSKGMAKTILNAAVLHDIGRCHQFKKGVFDKTVQHGPLGAEILQKKLPHLTQEIAATRFHAELPSDNDPEFAKDVLNYVRDADMLGNIRYEIEHIDVFLEQNKRLFTKEFIIDDEIVNAAQERRPAERQKFKCSNVLTSILTQVLWMFALKTDAAKELVNRQNLFIRYRDALISKALPMFCDDKECRQLIERILTIFPDSYFKEKTI